MSLSYDCALASLIISIAHELRHVEQYEIARGRLGFSGSKISSQSCLSLIVACDNEDFYKDNYKHMLHEIDAEKYGVTEAHKFLGAIFDDEKRTRESIVSSLCRSDEFNIGPVRYGSLLQDFKFEQFDNYMNDAEHEACVSLRILRSVSLDSNSIDFAASYFSLNISDYKDFLSLSNGLMQDAYLAAISMRYCKKSKSFFDKSSLSFPVGMVVPSGGILYKPIAVQEEKTPIDVGIRCKNDSGIVFGNGLDF